MGRPIKKSYFGSVDGAGIGGEGIASIAVGGAGANAGYTEIPVLQIAAPDLAGGVQAVARAHMTVEGIVNFFAGNSGYEPGQVLTLTGGTGTQGAITVDATKVSTVALSAGGDGYAVDDVVEVVDGTASTPAQIKITAIDDQGAGTGPATAIELVTAGSYTANPTLTGSTTSAVLPGTGAGLTVDLTMNIDLASVTTGGDYTALPNDVSIVGHSGAGGALFNLTYKVLSADVVISGSGYISAPVITENPVVGATYTASMTAVTANAISVVANVTGAGAKAGDIVKQEASRRYLITTSDGTGQCALVAQSPNAVGQMTMTAKDSDGGTYYVLKLTARRAVIIKGDRDGVQFTTGTDGISVPWVFNTAAIENESVEIVSA